MIVLALVALVQVDLKFCFYDSDPSRCGSEYTSIKVGGEEFKRFSEQVYQDVDAVDMLVTCDFPSSDVLGFKHFVGSGQTVTISAVSGEEAKKAYLDLSGSSVTSLRLSGIHVARLDGSLDHLALDLSHSSLPAVSDVQLSKLTSDVVSMAWISRVKADVVDISVGDAWGSKDLTVNLTSPKADVTVRNIEKDLTVELIGSCLVFRLNGTSGCFKLNWPDTTNANPMKILHEKSGKTLTLKSFVYGMGVNKPCYFDVTAGAGTIVSIPRTMWPNAEFMTDIAGTIRCHGAQLELSNPVTPISVEISNGQLTLDTENVTITGTVSLGKSVSVVPNGCTTVKFGSLVLLEDADSVVFDVSDVVVLNTLTVNTKKFEFQGKAMYSIYGWSESVFDLTFSNLDVSNAFTAAYNLQGSSHISVQGVAKGNAVTINMKWSGQKPTPAEVVEKQGLVLPLMDLPSKVSFTVLFDAAEDRGFSAGSHVFSSVEGDNSCSIKLDHTIDEFATRFCWDTTEGEHNCSAGSFDLNANNLTLDDWPSMVRPDVRLLEFELVSGPKNPFNITQYKNLTVKFVAAGPRTPVVVTKELLESVDKWIVHGGAIAIIKVGSAEIVPRGSWELKNTMIAGHSIETLRCHELESATTDAATLRTKLFEGCKPANLIIESDEFSTVEFHDESLTFYTEDGTPLDLPVEAGPRPHVVFNLNRPDLKFIPDENATKFLPVIEFTNVHPEHTLTIGDFPDSFHGLFGYAINGTLVVEGSHGQVPIDIIGNKNVNVRSDKNVDIIYPWCVNTHLEPVSMSAGTELKFEEAYFGTSSNITMPQDVTFHVVNGYQNHYGRIKAPVNRMRLSKNMTMWPYSELPVDDFDFIGKNASFHIMYRLAEMPYMRLDRPDDHVDYTPTVTLAYQDGNDDEIKFMSEHSDLLEGYEIPVICGKNLACCSWHLVMKSSDPTFTENGPMQLTCKQISDSERCVVLRVKPQVHDGNKGAIIAACILGCVAAILIISFVILCIRRRSRATPGLRTEALLKST